MNEKTFAKINKKNVVENIEIATDEWVSNFHLSNKEFLYIEVTETTGYPYINSIFNLEINKFIEPKPYESWILNEKGDWVAPLPKPNYEIDCFWNEKEQKWVEIVE